MCSRLMSSAVFLPSSIRAAMLPPGKGMIAFHDRHGNAAFSLSARQAMLYYS